jgi:hypothetical protein
MRRGGLPRLRVHLRDEVAKAIEGQGVPRTLARRFAFQIALKCGSGEWGDRTVWIAIGAILREEIVQLKDRAGLSDRQIATILPKLSARQVEVFVEELAQADRAIARTILNAALEAADPLTAGRRFLAEYHSVAGQLEAIDPKVARTIANAAFAARAPREKALDLFGRFAKVIQAYKEVRRAMSLASPPGGARIPRRRPA